MARLAEIWPVLDVSAPTVCRIVTGHTEDVTTVQVSPDGSWLASADEERGFPGGAVAAGLEVVEVDVECLERPARYGLRIAVGARSKPVRRRGDEPLPVLIGQETAFQPLW